MPEERHEKQVEKAVARARAIQEEIARADAKGAPEARPMQAGAREYPVPPFPEQHQPKPGIEATLKPEPMYDAPYWTGSGKLDGMVALITGADSGIGRAVAVLFAREGANIAIAYLSEDADARKTKEMVEAEGQRAILLRGDAADAGFCREAVERVISDLGAIDVLVNNAAFQVHAKDFLDLSDEHFDMTIKTNLYGYFHMAKAAVPHMRPGSVILNSGSVTGIRGSGKLVDYSMTKGGIHAFTRALSSNLLPRGIRVNAVAPGPVWSPLNPSDRDAEEVAHFGGGAPMQRPAQPEEVAPAYLFLASPQSSSYITGEILPVVGGY